MYIHIYIYIYIILYIYMNYVRNDISIYSRVLHFVKDGDSIVQLVALSAGGYERAECDDIWRHIHCLHFAEQL